MITLEYPKANILIELERGLNGYNLVVKKGKKLLLGVTFPKMPNISLTEAGLLYVNDFKTYVYDLNSKAPLTPIREDRDLWVASYYGNNVYTSAQPNAMIKDLSGNVLTGFVVRNEDTKECKVISDQIKFNPMALKMSPDGKKWLVYDVRNKNVIFGNEGTVIAKFAWNKGQLGDMSEEFEVDWENGKLFVAVNSMSFVGILSIDFTGNVEQTNIDKNAFMQPKVSSGAMIDGDDDTEENSIVEPNMSDELATAYTKLMAKIEKIGYINLLTIIAKLQDADLMFATDGDVMSPDVLPLLRLREHNFVGLLPFQGTEMEKWPVVFYDDEGGEIRIFATSLAAAAESYFVSVFDTKTHYSTEEKNRLLDPSVREELLSELRESPDLQAFVNALIAKVEKGDVKMSELYNFAEGDTFMTKHYLQVESDPQKPSEFTIVKSLPDWDRDMLIELLQIGSVTENQDYKGYLGWVMKEKKMFEACF